MTIVITHNLEEFQAALRKLPGVFTEAAKDTAKLAEKEALDLFRPSISSWTHPSNFESSITPRGGNIEVTIWTDDPIYKFVDQGTRPHTISPRGPYPLRFQEGYNPKTKPGSLFSGPGGPYGAEVTAWSVKHPGTEARDFSGQVSRVLGPRVWEEFKAKIGRLLRRALGAR